MADSPPSTDLSEARAAESARLMIEARGYVAAGRLADALVSARAAARADSRNAEAFATWGVAAAELGDFIEALEPLTVAAERVPPGSVGWVNVTSQLARAQSNVGFWAEAVRRATAVERFSPPDAMVRQRIGATLARVGLIERGLPHLQWAQRAMPDLPQAQLELGVAYLTLGRLEEAERALETAISLAPQWIQPHMALSTMRRWTPETSHIDRLIQLRDHPQTPPIDRASLGYSLFKELNDVERFEEAWPVLHEANDVARGEFAAWSPDEERDLIGALKQTFPVNRFITSRGRVSHPEARSGRTPIFIVGLPRSGTTLTERVLASHPQVMALGELPTFPILFRGASTAGNRRILNAVTVRATAGADWRDIAARYRSETAFMPGQSAFVTDKLPANSLLVGAIRLAFPDSPIVYVRRDPMDTLYSCYRVQFSGIYDWSYRLEDLAEHYANHLDLMAHWRACLGDGLIEMSYEDLVADPDAQIRRLLADCGLDFDPACLTPHETAGAVRTASIVQVRRPISQERIGGWRRYAAGLEPLRSRLQALGLHDG